MKKVSLQYDIASSTNEILLSCVQDEIKEILEVYPEVVDRTIQQGDAYAIVCGLKEPKGRVRVLGVGPTPQDIGTPELKS